MTVRVGLQRVADPRDATKMLGHMLGITPGSVALEHLCAHCGASDHGQPLLLVNGEYAAPRISISRTPHWLAVAVTDGENPAQHVGVDIETVKRVARHDVHSVAYSPTETSIIASLDAHERAPAATQLWTAKEAVTKALGVGLRADLTSFECSVVGPVVNECTVSHPGGIASVHFHSPHAGVLAAVATVVPEPILWLAWGR